MELLFGAASSIILEIYKWLARRYGVAASQRAIYLGLFALTLIWTALLKTQIINEAALRSFISMLLYAVGIYELLIKNLKLAL